MAFFRWTSGTESPVRLLKHGRRNTTIAIGTHRIWPSTTEPGTRLAPVTQHGPGELPCLFGIEFDGKQAGLVQVNPQHVLPSG